MQDESTTPRIQTFQSKCGGHFDGKADPKLNCNGKTEALFMDKDSIPHTESRDET